MTETRWRALVALADTGSVRAAATRLMVTESAVSAAVSALAREIGVALVEPEGRGLRLTPAGAVFTGYCRTVLGLLDEGAAAAAGQHAPERGRLRLAAVTTAADHVLPGLLAGFRRAYPQVDLALQVGPSNQVWDRLANHEADLVIAGRPPDETGRAVVATRANELVATAAPELADGFDLASAPWLLREPGSGTRTTLEAYLVGQQVEPPQLVLGSNGAVIAGAAAGLGAALVHHEAITEYLAAGSLALLGLPDMPLQRPWHAVTGPHPPPTARLFAEHLRAAGWRVPT